MNLENLPQSPNVDDRQNSWIDHLMTLLSNPLRSQWYDPQSLNSKALPTIASDFPSYSGPTLGGTGLAKAVGYDDIPNSALARLLLK